MVTTATRQGRRGGWRVTVCLSGSTHRLALPKLLLGTVEVKVHVEALHKLRDGVLVGVGLLEEENRQSIMSLSILPLHLPEAILFVVCVG